MLVKDSIAFLALCLLLALLLAGTAQSEDGLVAEWHFDEGAGNVVKDSSGNGNDGTIYGAKFVDGKFGKALSFDGVDDYVEVYDSPILDITNAITIEAWVKMNSMEDMLIVGKEYNQYGFVYGMGWLTPGGTPPRKFVGRTATGGSTNELGYIWSPEIEQFYHLTFTFNGILMKLYINGVEVSSLKQSGSFNRNDKSLIIGMRSGNNDLHFNGLIDEVRIYNRALSPEEIKEQYENGPTALSLTKIATPQSIKQGQTTTITLTAKNTGSTEITDIEIADVIPKDLTLIDGETTKTYTSLSPKDSRQFQYSVQINEAGTFNLGQATASYADNKGNYQTIRSKPASIEVIPSLVTDSKQTPIKKSNENAQSASVNLHGEKTDVTLGENVLLKLSAVNIIGNPAMHVQVIIIPPSGWSVTSSEFAESGAGQYSTTYDLKSGGGKDIEVRIVPNQVGDDFKVEGRIVYYFGDDVATREDHTLDLPIKVRERSNVEMTAAAPQNDNKSTPGFAFVIGIVGFVIAALLINNKSRF